MRERSTGIRGIWQKNLGDWSGCRSLFGATASEGGIAPIQRCPTPIGKEHKDVGMYLHYKPKDSYGVTYKPKKLLNRHGFFFSFRVLGN